MLKERLIGWARSGRGKSQNEPERSPAPVVDTPVILLKAKLEAAIHYMPNSGIVYMNNAKSGCSSIKTSLWMSRAPETFTQPHAKGRSPFVHTLPRQANHVEGMERAEVFTMVRNPYARTLSAYLDKIATGKGGPAGKHFRDRFQITGRIPGFTEYLELLASDTPELIDQHFAPQFFTTCHAFVRFDFIGHLENMTPVSDWLNERDIGTEEFRRHATKASESFSEHYTAKDHDLVRELYARDFEAFGYSDDPAEQAPVRPANLPDVPKSNLTDLVKLYASEDRAVEEKLLDRLAVNAPVLDQTYLKLDAGVMDEEELKTLRRGFLSGEDMSWQIGVRLAEMMDEQGRTRAVERLNARVAELQFPELASGER